ncbi:VTT domain-containing protein [Streptomyces sp. NPDC047002]|uniref:TVP38/TMEM64 family protein n=1 Tax=Streptomyces sp. NPDC047002 TaxID=3155475 RepID=UPI0034518B3C
MLDTASRPAPARASSRVLHGLLSPWGRFALLVAVLGAAAALVAVYRPQHLLSGGGAAPADRLLAAALFAAVYGLCAAAFAPRPLLNAAAGALLGTAAGLAAAIAGTVLAAGIAFGLGRVLGQGALRPLVRGRWLTAADGLMSRYGFRSMLALRLFPGVPFAAVNYGAAVSRMRWPSFLVATGLGSVPNTAAYVVAGSTAASPASPAFVAATAFIAVSAAVACVVAWRKRHRLGAAARAHGDGGPPRTGA